MSAMNKQEISEQKSCSCGCGGCSKAPMLNEQLVARTGLSEGILYHIDNKKPLTEHLFRAGSQKYFDLWAEARMLYSRDLLEVKGDDLDILLETDLGHFGEYNGKKVPLDFIFEEELDERTFEDKEIAIYDDPNGDAGETKIYKRGTGYYGVNDSFDFEAKDKAELEAKLKRWGYVLQAGSLNEAEKKKKATPELNKPKRGGSKKFYVYVRDPKSGNIKKVSFGQAGMSAKINNPKARAAFSKRHNCPAKTDKTKASYWSCRLPRYAKQLGLKSNFSGFW